jgi:hypothetical protein
MDSKHSKTMCWEITGCGSQDTCKILELAKASGKQCWDVVGAFDDYRSALNVCGDCIVSVLSRQKSLSAGEINDLRRRKGDSSSHRSCPGLMS